MKIILSRKGFDSSCGGCPSPILEDGSLVSLPIPERGSPVTFAEISAGAVAMDELVSDLTNGARAGSDRAHLDPDLRADSVSRAPGWRPLFGQADAAQAHLANAGVGPGDLFLFFGWFREADLLDGRWRFVPGAPDRHVVFGWLSVGQVWTGAALATAPDWARQHPHIASGRLAATSSVYAAARGRGGAIDAGAFASVCDDLVLTAPGQPRSQWLLPGWFHPEGRRTSLSYHGRASRWQRRGAHTLLSTVGRGQEFVLDTDSYPEAVEWSRRLIAAGRSSRQLAAV